MDLMPVAFDVMLRRPLGCKAEDFVLPPFEAEFGFFDCALKMHCSTLYCSSGGNLHLHSVD